MIEIRDELLAIMAGSDDQMLHAEQAVNWAGEHPDSALHARLQWDDAVAGHEYRLQQMRQLIQLHIRIETGEPRLISLTYDRSRGGGYREKAEVFRSRHLAEIAETDAMRELVRVRRKYGHIKRLAAVWHEIDHAEAKPRGDRSASAEPASPAA